ncbi:MAG: heme lyase CcmF/NrfE family subunit [Hyphomicrobiaceae bacterium]|nr:heme lyase CcmF/NrfE family subunit [Hyphomicrobiaceae bacterium]
MSIELGHFAMVLAFALAAGQAIVGMLFWQRDSVTPILQQASLLTFILVAIAFAALLQAFALSDFSVALVYEYSHSQQPLLFKLTSVWGNHEGSMLLWVLILVIFGAALAVFGRNLPTDLANLTLTVQSAMIAAFSGFILFTSNPFLRLSPAPLEGRDLNPVLQDIGLAIHPPLLYLGYVGLSVCFAFAVAALVSGRIDAAWARWVRPWTLASWMFLTLGIAMGSYWAYYELGWGGWWYWDPVENASFMPWLAATALLHSALVMEKRNALKVWSIFLAIVAFSLSLLGTFLVRSGILTSVHSFASDPTRGIVILAILAVIIGGAFVLFALRANALKAGGVFAPISREGALVLNNLFLATGVVAVFVGTLYPLLLEAMDGQRISVGAPFFNLTFGALMVPLVLLVPFGPYLPWKRADLSGVVQRMVWAMAATLVVWLIVAFTLQSGATLTTLGLLLGTWIVVGAAADILDRIRLGRIPLGESMRRLTGLPRTAWSTAIAHFGLGVSILGIVIVSSFQTENITTLKAGESLEISGYTVTLSGSKTYQGPNYVGDAVGFAIVTPGGSNAEAVSEKRVYTAQRMPSTEAAITNFGFSQLYLAIGDQDESGAWVVRAWFKPYVTLVWIGALIMAAGGLLSLTDRRLRIGAPKPARTRQKAEAA